MIRVLAGISVASTLAAGAIVAGQQLPSAPAKGFGTSITASFEGWYENPDGTRTFLIGYYNRNVRQAMDIPIGPNNRIEPGGPDLGQPTHFLPGRHTGTFTVAVPKGFRPEDRLTWTIVANDLPTNIPFRLNPDYIISPFVDSAVGNKPPAIRFDENGPALEGPTASMTKTLAKTATVNRPLALTVWASDDAKYTSGTNAPLRNPPPPVRLTWSKYRGPGPVTFDKAQPALEVLAGGNIGEPFRGKAVATAKFSEPGEYVLEVVAHDYSGEGGAGELCCWTNGLVKVTVSP
jgi:hypothetical protein